MAIDKSFIGRETEDRFIDVEKGQLALFAMATGQTDPIYSDENAAKAAGLPGIPLPPTFVFSLGNLAQSKEFSIADMGINLPAVLHGEQNFTYHHPIFSGDRIRLRSKVVDIYDKKGGALDFIVQDTTAHNQNDELCVTARTVIVVRN